MVELRTVGNKMYFKVRGRWCRNRYSRHDRHNKEYFIKMLMYYRDYRSPKFVSGR